MSEVAFQRALGRLVTDHRFRQRLGRGESVPAGLSSRERRRIAALAVAPGVALTARLIDSFRLGKLITLLPLTRALLGPARFAREAEVYCAKTPPTSFYLADEALAFCDHLAVACRRPYLAEVAAYERAMIELKRPWPDGAARPSQRIVFHHDPARLLPALARGERPRAVPRRRCVAVGFVGADGQVDWRIETQSGIRAAATRRLSASSTL
jgi:hypothetical protein